MAGQLAALQGKAIVKTAQLNKLRLELNKTPSYRALFDEAVSLKEEIQLDPTGSGWLEAVSKVSPVLEFVSKDSITDAYFKEHGPSLFEKNLVRLLAFAKQKDLKVEVRLYYDGSRPGLFEGKIETLKASLRVVLPWRSNHQPARVVEETRSYDFWNPSGIYALAVLGWHAHQAHVADLLDEMAISLNAQLLEPMPQKKR